MRLALDDLGLGRLTVLYLAEWRDSLEWRLDVMPLADLATRAPRL
jgi:hypothetical protein